jgi:glycosyltransferase involved in cell wall biosynthesis
MTESRSTNQGGRASAMKRLLMVAYHFPPLAGSSGIQRTLRFMQQLPDHGWDPVVLTTHERAYERTSNDLLAEVPASVPVRRALALDAARHLSWRGRYIGATARPDRWVSWKLDGVRQGLQMIREYRPSVLWSTYPIATAHLIGLQLARRSGLPWVADFRDPMAQPGYPEDPAARASFTRLERDVFEQATVCVFTTPGAAQEYRLRFPAYAGKVTVIENGFDEETFSQAQALHPGGPLRPQGTTWLHSGIIYPSERDPAPLMAALGRLKRSGLLRPRGFVLRFRAAVAEDLLHRLAAQNDVSEHIEVLPAIPYREALAEMLRADALVVMQASNCNQQIPAKLYEYLRSGRPIIGLTDPAGDTAGVLRQAGVRTIAALDNVDGLVAFIDGVLSSALALPESLPQPPAVAQASRAARTRQLAALLDKLVPA